MARRYISLVASDPARRVVGGDNVLVNFYVGRSDAPASAFLDLTSGETITLPLRANPGTEHFIRIQPGAGDTTIQVDSTTGWLRGDVLRFRSGSTQIERAIKTITDADTVELDAAIGFAFPIGSAIRGQVGHARVAVPDTSDYSADVQNVGEGWRSVRIDFYVLQTTAQINFEDEGSSIGQFNIIDIQGDGIEASDGGGGQLNLVHDGAGHPSANDRLRWTVQDLGNQTGAITINLALGDIIRATLTGNVSITLTNPIAGHDYKFIFEQDGTGSRTVTWTTTIKWFGGAAPVATLTVSKKDLFILAYDETDYLGSFALNA